MIKPVALGTAALLLQSLVAPCGAQLTSRIAFVSGRDGNNEIYVMETDGSDQRNLTHGPWSDIAPCWSPDGRRIAFASDRKGSYDIHVMDADGGNLVRLTESPGVDAAPAWSPDGHTIVFNSDRGGTYSIYGMDVDRPEPYQLTDDTAHDVSPAWSPDGRSIAFSSQRRMDAENVASGLGSLAPILGGTPRTSKMGTISHLADVFVMDRDGTDLVNLTGHTNLVQSNYPAWTPDGTRILFYSLRHVPGSALLRDLGLYVVDLSRNVTYLSGHDPGNAFSPSWSPDGSRVVYSGYPGSMDWTIYMVDAEGRNQVQLTASAVWNSHEGDHDPAWSPPMEDETQVPSASWGKVKAESR
jgi:Tol biopolymer transport system component